MRVLIAAAALLAAGLTLGVGYWLGRGDRDRAVRAAAPDDMTEELR